MPDFPALLISIHALAAVIWVGGMVFAYAVLRPSLGSFKPAERLSLWDAVFRRFFPVVWAAVVALPVTGYWLVFGYFGGFSGAGLHIHLMHGVGLAMIALFLHLYFAPYRRFRAAVAAREWPVAAANLTTIRRVVATNIGLGLAIVAIGASGRFWG